MVFVPRQVKNNSSIVGTLHNLLLRRKETIKTSSKKQAQNITHSGMQRVPAGQATRKLHLLHAEFSGTEPWRLIQLATSSDAASALPFTTKET